ncbi:hypothetical protein COU78_02580 [Candidatus Peregrinibacteria bacterium CG10_big_fil_rev_8_21_14_0_10_49_24]|nr:MAG: hypothetical protein COV83_02560 [Candidatus Peregrinibacteria bacterium CG11_big_fil_rev_8_21_14_0_20_49_14]PIR51023.1 MAG: hypothetical protein COU78_02580 [Candidatus Peregrinibacteria bacterium CG10_big_fil_rev_8_21_14_0_10_49_24]PJA67576.1 MAG: hypothetical protein CO157_04060 [Candidatus Peregrinibacteria bacterium CG_4_9_14_3_um_filter_49_12]
MSDDSFLQQVSNRKELTQQQEQSAGTPVAGKMGAKHTSFLSDLFALIDKGDIRTDEPQTFLNQEVYEKLSDEWKDKTDLALTNIANQLRLIDSFRKDTNTPVESPQLQTMVEQLWQMKQRIEEDHDVFKF